MTTIEELKMEKQYVLKEINDVLQNMYVLCDLYVEKN